MNSCYVIASCSIQGGAAGKGSGGESSGKGTAGHLVCSYVMSSCGTSVIL